MLMFPLKSTVLERDLGRQVAGLFGAGEQGCWYDVADTSTLFQDSAGTIPVTAVGQQVGRMLDKSGRGNHATQVTATKRPVFSRRYNLLDGTNNFGGSYWIADDGTVAGGYADSSGGLTAYKYTPGVNNVGTHRLRQWRLGAAATRVLTFRFKPINYSYIKLRSNSTWANFNLSNKTVGYSRGILNATVADVGSGWFDVSIVSNTALAYVYIYPMIDDVNSIDPPAFSGDGVSGVIVERAALVEEADAHLPYQWVNTATDYDADPAKFPAYLRFDGVDDALKTGNIDFTAPDKMTVCAGITKGTVTGMVTELSPNGETNAGGVYLIVNDGGGYASNMRTNVANSPITIPGFASADQAVITLTMNIPEASRAIRRNSTSSVTSAIAGTGAFGNYPLYIGSRAGTVLYFNGRLYSLIVRGAQTPPSQIKATELYIKQKMRMP